MTKFYYHWHKINFLNSHKYSLTSAKLPTISNLSIDKKIVNSGDDVKLTCRYVGIMTSSTGKQETNKIVWTYGDKSLQNNNELTIISNDTASVLTLKTLVMASTGRYSCSVENRAGIDRKTLTVNIKGMIF